MVLVCLVTLTRHHSCCEFSIHIATISGYFLWLWPSLVTGQSTHYHDLTGMPGLALPGKGTFHCSSIRPNCSSSFLCTSLKQLSLLIVQGAGRLGGHYEQHQRKAAFLDGRGVSLKWASLTLCLQKHLIASLSVPPRALREHLFPLVPRDDEKSDSAVMYFPSFNTAPDVKKLLDDLRDKAISLNHLHI